MRREVHPVLALDLATRTGWAIRDRDGTFRSGVESFKVKGGESPGMRFLRARAWVADKLEELAPTLKRHKAPVVAWERPHHRGRAATEVLLGLQAVVQEEVARFPGAIGCHVETGTVKKHATGNGRASKSEMVAAAGPYSLLVGHVVEAEDEADALHVLFWALDEIGEGMDSVPPFGGAK